MSTNLLLRFSFFTCHLLYSFIFFFFFNDTATTEIYTLSLHDALPISSEPRQRDHGDLGLRRARIGAGEHHEAAPGEDRKSTRLNSSHLGISYAVFCLKKKKKKKKEHKNINNKIVITKNQNM